jgi:hypothetical protein
MNRYYGNFQLINIQNKKEVGMIRRIAKPLSLFLIFSFLLLDLTVITAKAGIIGTEAVINTFQEYSSRARVSAFLERQEVQEAFIKKGIDPALAKTRVAGLTDQEIAQICKTLDQLPAGGDGLGTVVGAIVLIFLILLLTDLLGLTNVFPFVVHQK